MSLRNTFTVVALGTLIICSVGAGLVVGQSDATTFETLGETWSTSEQVEDVDFAADVANGPSVTPPGYAELTNGWATESGPEPYATTRWNASFVGDPGGTAVADGTVYLGVTTHRDYNQRTGRVTAYDAATGDVRWTREGLGGVTAAPTVANGTVYAATDAKVSSYTEPADGAGGLYALDAESGETEWMRNTSEKWTGKPVLADGRLYAIRGPETVDRDPDSTDRPLAGNRSLVALDPATGATTWSVPADELIGVAGDTIVATDGPQMVAYDLASHDRTWEASLPQCGCNLATLGTDAVYVSSSSDRPHVQAYALSDGARQWNATVGEAGGAAFEPTVAHGSVFVTTTTDDSSAVHRLDAANGTQSWRYDRPVDDLRSSPAVGNDSVYVSAAALSERDEPGSGALLPYQRSPAVLAIDEANGSEQWGYLDRAVRTDSKFDLGMERPVIVDGGLYLTASDQFMDSELSGALVALESAETEPNDAHTPTDGVHEDNGPRPSVTVTTETIDPSERFGENETVELTAHAAVTGGTLASVEWDVDGDGTFERNGTTLTVTLEQCEERTITARATAESGATATETVSLKNAA